MIWFVAYAVLGVAISLIAPFLLTERHEEEIRRLGGDGIRVAVCVIAGVVWPVLLVEYAIRGLIRILRALRRLTWLGVLNFLVLQWFGVRLARVYARELECGRVVNAFVVPGGGISVGSTWQPGRRVQIGWKLLRWIVPLTGWWSDYRYIARRS